MNLYLVKMQVDRGCRFDNYDCVVYTDSETRAKIKAEIFFNCNLSGEDYAIATEVRKQEVTPQGIVYQNCFEEIAGIDKE